MVRLAVVPWGVFALRATKPRRRQTALRGQARPPFPDKRTATMSQIAPQKPLRAVRRLLKTTGSISSRSSGPRQATPGGIETPIGSGRLSPDRIVPVSLWLGVRATSAGDRFLAFALFTQAPGPRRGGQSKFGGVGPVTHRAKGIDRDPRPTPWWPVWRSPWLPQFGQQLPAPGRCFHVIHSQNVH